ncbi:MAG: short-chain dehydrogenase [Candidatus Nephthysia bennettiae]|uniref:SDR family oxidoreductase n=1 Tax=Candidatus Nephthysia bennettiae TaxID=3127016 RepID=A0A934K5A1_9BACT|nr:SDR family oxidoreductase [Candidatus Dormibacteraeota bacterium]MBJ7613791.1 SDR family oxidoreductase [Candidatus Dormibacteraeota bacterium]PZR95557.1 MAG: short-chain dehydrogenase [Candidatus Dormibacteraeota bacterium]
MPGRIPTAIVTGGSRGLGLALAGGLRGLGWALVIDARDPDGLQQGELELRRGNPSGAPLVAIAGDVRDAAHRRALVEAARDLGGLDLLVNNAGVLGPNPLPPLADYPLDGLREVVEVNLVAPLALFQATADLLRAAPGGGRVVMVTSDAAVEAYPGWGGYGAAKAAVEQLAAVLAAEEPGLRVWWVDPGDLRTRMHQEAFPGEDISDRPLPEAAVAPFLRLLDSDRTSGRVRLADMDAAGSDR